VTEYDRRVIDTEGLVETEDRPYGAFAPPRTACFSSEAVVLSVQLLANENL
jgi:hypothetical protein